MTSNTESSKMIIEVYENTLSSNHTDKLQQQRQQDPDPKIKPSTKGTLRPRTTPCTKSLMFISVELSVAPIRRSGSPRRLVASCPVPSVPHCSIWFVCLAIFWISMYVMRCAEARLKVQSTASGQCICLSHRGAPEQFNKLQAFRQARYEDPQIPHDPNSPTKRYHNVHTDR